MAKYTKEELAEVKKQKGELLSLLLKRTGVKRQDLIDMITNEFIRKNLDLVTPADKKHFNKLVF